MADTPSTVTLIDGTGQQVTFLATTNGTGQKTIQSTPRVGDAPVDAENPMPVLSGGTSGKDYSVNEAAIPFPGFAVLVTVPVNPSRANIQVQNMSASLVQVVQDDGEDQQQTAFFLAPGTDVGQPGGFNENPAFKGRLRVCAPVGSWIVVSEV